jgi:hypothetical protein
MSFENFVSRAGDGMNHPQTQPDFEGNYRLGANYIKRETFMARELQKANPMKNNKPTHEEISARAFQIFVERGCPEGRDLEHWLEAEAQLCAEAQPKAQQETAIPPTAKAPKAASRQAAARRA